MDPEYEYHDGYRTFTRDDYENSRAYDWCAVKKEEITHKFRLIDQKLMVILILVFLVID